MTAGTLPAAERRWFGHPSGLTILFLTQTWEQFSYYGMRALLIYYMTKALRMDAAQASFIFGLFVAFFYLTPIVGGMVTDAWLGRKRAIIVGAVTMAAGHFLLAFDGWLYAALAVIAIGNGFFLPAVPSQIGDLYANNDPRRSGGYTLYYLGINLGGFLAPFVCGSLGELYGWHWGFGAAGVGMLVGLLIYLAGHRHLPQEPAREPNRRLPLHLFDRQTLRLFLLVGIGVTLFRGAYQQVGSIIALWIDSGVDRDAAGFEIPMTWFQSLNPLFVFALTPLIVALSRRGERPHLPRMATGAVLVAAACFLLAILAETGGAHVSWPWLLLFFFLLTLGELYVLPVGLDLFAGRAPAGARNLAVAAWYFTIFTGSLYSGFIGRYWTAEEPAAFFLLIGLSSVAGAMLLAWIGRRSVP